MVFKNETKKTEKSPDYSVKAKIGEAFETVGGGWVKTSGKGTKFISLSLQVIPLQKMLGNEQTLTPQQAQDIKEAREMEIANREAQVQAINTSGIDF